MVSIPINRECRGVVPTAVSGCGLLLTARHGQAAVVGTVLTFPERHMANKFASISR